MTKKDYERAATLVQAMYIMAKGNGAEVACARAATHVFAQFFADDNPRFDEARFRAACIPGANVWARPRKGS